MVDGTRWEYGEETRLLAAAAEEVARLDLRGEEG